MNLTAKELADARAVAALTMTSSATPLTASKVANDRGGRAVTWNAGAGRPCRLVPLRGREGAEAGRIYARKVFALTLPHDATTSEGARERVGGVDYEVLQVFAPQSPSTIVVRAWVAPAS